MTTPGSYLIYVRCKVGLLTEQAELVTHWECDCSLLCLYLMIACDPSLQVQFSLSDWHGQLEKGT